MAATADIRRLVLALFPPGADSVYDYDNTDSDIYKLLDAMAEAARVNISDVLDILIAEAVPITATEVLTEWETLFNLSPSSSAGATVRRDAVLARIREFGASTFPNIRAALQPLLQYAAADLPITIMETDRSDLTTAHTYTLATGAIPGGGSFAATYTVGDVGRVSRGGVTLNVTLTGDLDDFTITITAPDASVDTIVPSAYGATGAVVAQALVFRVAAGASAAVNGLWTVTITDGGAGGGTVHAASLFVEGIGRTAAGLFDGLGAAQFEWGPLVDPAKIGTTVDYVQVNGVVQRWNPAHCIGSVIRGTTLAGANNQAVPDDTSEPWTNAIPNQCFPG